MMRRKRKRGDTTIEMSETTVVEREENPSSFENLEKKEVTTSILKPLKTVSFDDTTKDYLSESENDEMNENSVSQSDEKNVVVEAKVLISTHEPNNENRVRRNKKSKATFTKPFDAHHRRRKDIHNNSSHLFGAEGEQNV